MSIEAFWKVGFASNHNDAGAGVVIFDSGKIYGGDSGFYYKGNYSVEGKNVTAKIRVKNYFPGFPSVFGNLKEFTLIFDMPVTAGDINGSQFMINGYMEENPKNHINIGFTRIESLT